MNFKLLKYLSIIFLPFIFCQTTNCHAFTVSLEPRLTLNEEYSDNINLTNEDTESDFITTISPGFTFSISGQSKGLSLAYDPSQSLYAEHAENNTLRHSVGLESWNNLSRNTRVYLNDTFLYTEDPLVEDVEDVSDRTGREPYYINTATLGISNQFGPSNTVTFGYTNTVLENEDDDVEDSRENSPSVALEYWFIQRLGMEGRTSYTRGEFDDSDDFERYAVDLRLMCQINQRLSAFIDYQHTKVRFDIDEDDNYQVSYPNVGFGYALGENTNVSIGGGYIYVEREKEDDEERFLLNSSVSHTWSFRHGFLSIDGSSGYDESYFDAENLGLRVYYQGSSSLTYELLQGVSGRLTGSYRNEVYLNTEDDRDDQTKTGTVGLIYSGLRYLTATLSYSYRIRESNEEEDEYEENRISFMLTLRPARAMYIPR